MENKEAKKRSLGQELAIELGGDMLGMGAGVLIGSAALGVVENIPGIGKPLKVLLKLGAYGLEITTMLKVSESMQEYIGNVCDAVSSVKKLFQPKEPVRDEAVKAEGAVE